MVDVSRYVDSSQIQIGDCSGYFPDRVPDMGTYDSDMAGKARAPDAVCQLLRDELTHTLADEDI